MAEEDVLGLPSGEQGDLRGKEIAQVIPRGDAGDVGFGGGGEAPGKGLLLIAGAADEPGQLPE